MSVILTEREDIREQLIDMEPTNTLSHKGDPAYSSSFDPLVDFYSKAGNFSPKDISYHGETIPVLSLFKDAWAADEYISMQLAMWMRDCRGGSGNRSGFRSVISWLSCSYPAWIKANLHFIPEVGRWDDLLALMDTPCEKEAIQMWAKAIQDGQGLACKWSPRESNNRNVYHKLRHELKMSPPQFRKHLAKHTKVVETQMCQQRWASINYNHIPSVAMARSFRTFDRHDFSRFKEWKASLANPDSKNKVNASVLFPHDCIRTLRTELSLGDGYYAWSTLRESGLENYKDSELANAQFAALPNFMTKNNMRILPICDFSGSMNDPISKGNSIQLIDISMSLGLYCSDRVGEQNPFYRKFIPFSETSRLVDWRNDTFSVAVQKYNDGWCGSTNIQAALDQIVEAGVLLNATNDQMPNCLLIISDMQWDCNVSGNETAVEYGMRNWDRHNFTRPRIVYWNLNRYESSPSTVEHKNVALISGYSPAVLTSVLEGEDFSPRAIMERAIAKYNIVRP